MDSISIIPPGDSDGMSIYLRKKYLEDRAFEECQFNPVNG